MTHCKSCKSSHCSCPKPPPCPPHPCPPKPCRKNTIALLELSGDGNVQADTNLKKTLEYYFENTKQFQSFPIVNTYSDLSYTLKLLDYYYRVGIRIFIGFSRSTILQGVRTWFENHPDTYGISPQSTDSSLNYEKNVYRVSPTDDQILAGLQYNPFFSSRRYIYYIYSEDEIAPFNFLNTLLADPVIGPKIRSFSVKADSSNMNLANMTTFYTDADASQDSTLLYLFDGNQRDIYLSLFNLSFVPIPLIDMSQLPFPIFNSFGETVWTEIYYSWQNFNLSTSFLWRLGNLTLQNEFNPVALNVLQLNKYIRLRIPLEDLSNFQFVQEFEGMTKENLYFSLTYYQYQNLEWKPINIFYKDPLYGYQYHDVM